MKKMAILGLAASILVYGCGKPGENKAKEAGKTVGGTVTDFVSGVGSGADNKMLVNVTVTPEMEKQGLSMTTAKSTGVGDKGITAYIIAKSAFKGTFISKAFNKEGAEIGRALAEVEFAADDAKYITFKFNSEMDSLLVDKYVLDIKK
jgi:hypothetical protein